MPMLNNPEKFSLATCPETIRVGVYWLHSDIDTISHLIRSVTVAASAGWEKFVQPR